MASQAAVVTALEIGEATDIGRGSGKERNEDSSALFEVRLLSSDSDGLQPGTVAVVADGMGGMVGGAEASQTALATIRQFMASPSNPTLSPSEWMATAIHEANATINQRAESSRELEGMGTTLVSVLITGSDLYLAHVGDSRAYLLRNGELRQMSRDHTWVQDALDRGRLSHEEARTHPNRHVLKRHLGTDSRLEVDQRIVDPTLPDEPPTFVSSIPLMAGDTILLCTDGLSDPVEAEAIRDALRRGTAQQSATELVRLANEAGGRDNITALVLRVPGGKFLPMRRAPKAMPLLPLVLGALLVVLLGGGAMMMRGRANDSPGVSAGGVALGTGGSAATQGDGGNESAPRGPQLPTAGPGDPGFVTSTAAPGQPTSTPFPTPTPAPPAAPGGDAGSSAGSAAGPVARGVTLLQPVGGQTISQQSPGFSAQLSGLQAGDSVALLVGQTQNLNTTHRAGVMQRSGDRYGLTLRSLTPGSYWWTVVIYSAQNREVARATARSFSVTGGAAPAATATARPSAPTTVPPTRPPAATVPPTAPATRTAEPPTTVPPTTIPPTAVPPTTVPPTPTEPPPPIITNTAVPPTNTAVLPTNTAVPPPTNTAVPPPTNTPVPPTATEVPPP